VARGHALRCGMIRPNDPGADSAAGRAAAALTVVAWPFFFRNLGHRGCRAGDRGGPGRRGARRSAYGYAQARASHGSAGGRHGSGIAPAWLLGVALFGWLPELAAAPGWASRLLLFDAGYGLPGSAGALRTLRPSGMFTRSRLVFHRMHGFAVPQLAAAHAAQPATSIRLASLTMSGAGSFRLGSGAERRRASCHAAAPGPQLTRLRLADVETRRVSLSRVTADAGRFRTRFATRPTKSSGATK
jgi:hypothetical protein